MVNNLAFKNAVRSLWRDLCTVKVKSTAKNAVGRSVQTEETLFSDVPCRLSFNSVTVPNETSHAALTVQSATLFIDKDLTIPAGSSIIVTHEGVTRVYVHSGEPSVYTYHQQIPLELQEEWA